MAKNDHAAVVSFYMDRIKVLGIDPTKHINIAQDLDQNRPESFLKAYSLSDAVMIRSYNSRDLNKNSNLV